ncbi:MAG: bifunctional folylpolyglutamate synthase/dihydrofolate synthase [Pikeienuella sp.]
MSTAESDAILARLLTLHPKIIDLTLDRVERLLADLGHPERDLAPVVHVAGTNGKGSVTAMLRAGLEGGGGRVQAYTSPHLARFHERIRLANGLIPETDLAELLAECERVNGGRAITFFEITTCAALLAFARQPADWTLLEVGLGGRLDATNVLDHPRLTVITPVSYDHQQYLGETLTEIASEKAGILKPGVPCVVGRQAPEAMAAIEARAAQIGAPLHVAGRDWQLRQDGEDLVFEGIGDRRHLPRPRLPGLHQIDNAGIALMALDLLGVGDAAAAMTRVHWPARMQDLSATRLASRLPDGSELWLDGGHNPAAGAALAALLAEMGRRTPSPLWLVVGMIDTKSPAEFLAPLAKLAAGMVAVPVPDSAASIEPRRLAEIGRTAGHIAEEAGGVGAALDLIRAHARAAQGPLRVLICGSLYLAGAVLREIDPDGSG